jgi:hypothetical protein
MRSIVLCCGATLALGPAAAAAAPQRCNGLTTAAVAKTIGRASASVESSNAYLNTRSCTWRGEGRGARSQPLVTVQVTSGMTLAMMEYGAEQVPRAVLVRGAGQFAFAQGTILYAYGHGYLVKIVSVLLDAPLAMEKRLANRVLAGLRGSGRTGIA